ncbi:class I SAM-dependent methyltransferase [Anaeromicropila herbilytica]|uniref:Arsenite methyltransferase n=1 Tax=Anaeromicropila herbilytica TaxID=2785025 RepID=A0A7R7IDD2_9FIRM|nr:class I SAM-dependent methyltransferase [Anaeromicropila herbilytica]BCN30816.1 hypothetical protein bsdtb5_21110 [Anaeromicropila herbilytica]
MNEIYKKCSDQWNEIFSKDTINIPENPITGNQIFDGGLKWLTTGTESVLDFGCGSGTILFLCGLYGTKNHIGIDLSETGIEHAILRSKKMTTGTYTFYHGGIDKIQDIENDSVDAIILSNIIDNLYPVDAKKVLEEVHRILKSHGKVFIKLNPYITEEQMKEWNIKVVDGNLLDDGLYLWNNTKEEWEYLIGSYFHIEQYQEIYYEQYEQTNRLFLATK